MTTVIDHAIAIPTRPANVWDVLKDVSNYPNWHPDSQRVQYLTTLRHGRGVRWRNTTQSNKEQVFEITAWYEGLGYEYRIVDGTSYVNNRGRIRLQEAPEGTVVQWTFSYETSGFLSNLRNNLSMKSSADKEIVQGLRNIYVLIKEAKADEMINPEASKSYLKEAPNVQERASYQPRHPSKVSSQEIPAVSLDDSPFMPPKQASEPLQPEGIVASIEEPPLTDDDTRPNPTVQTTNTVPSAPAIDEPDFLKSMPDAQVVPSASQADTGGTTSEDETVANRIGSSGETETVPFEPETLAVLPPKAEDDSSNPVQPLIDDPDFNKRDTSTISVFEVFGLEKPSETEPVRTLSNITANTDDEEASIAIEISEPLIAFMDSAPIIPDVQPDIPERRRGLRAVMRRRGLKLRVPKSE
ncbi:MAG: SRPBCC family protein [Chloroflexota bacterium]